MDFLNFVPILMSPIGIAFCGPWQIKGLSFLVISIFNNEFSFWVSIYSNFPSPLDNICILFFRGFLFRGILFFRVKYSLRWQIFFITKFKKIFFYTFFGWNYSPIFTLTLGCYARHDGGNYVTYHAKVVISLCICTFKK